MTRDEHGALRLAALHYASRGLRVFPVRRNRVPCIRAWPTAASSDPAQIEAWWRSWPDANIRALTGGAFFVVDVDPRNGGDASLASRVAEHGPLPPTLTCVTGGGGTHLYFATTGAEIKTSQGSALGAGIDILGLRSSVTLPPSVHASGRRYEWRRPLDAITDPPLWLLDRVTVKALPPQTRSTCTVEVSTSYARRAVEDEIGRVASAVPGTRNRTLNAATFNLATLAGASLLRAEDVEAWMLDAAAACGLPAAEARSTVRCALRAGLARPRRVALAGGTR